MNWHASKKVWIDLGCKYAVGNIGWTTAYGMIAMLNSRVIREKDAHLHFELMAYLIRQYQTNKVQRVIYDPANCVEPGYFTAAIALQLARVRCAKFEAETPLSPIARRKIILGAAAYNRLGFVLASHAEALETLQLLAEPKPRRRPVLQIGNPSGQRQSIV